MSDPTARAVVLGALLDARAELIALRVPSRAIHALDRQLALVAKPLPTTPEPAPAPAPSADRDELERFAQLLLHLRDGAMMNGHMRDAAALLRAAKLIANERRVTA